MDDATLQMDEDSAWRGEGERHSWTLPPKAAWPLRLPIIRHARGYWHAFHMNRMVNRYASVSIGVGVPNQFDLWVLYAIFRGWC